MPWYSSWIPGLPTFNFAIPASIQGRFISFVLKKTLGHLLKPGQLDYHQIDSQIGSGYVQVNDLELNPETINKYLHGLPLSLQDGTISAVKARIPWPNPLASTLGFSVKSLHLILCVTSANESEFMDERDVANSMESVAESFMHDELSSQEEATLWKSFHEELREAQPEAEVHFLPGGMDTFSTVPSAPIELDMDPAGVSVFAGLIERLLARFEFDAQDITITLIHPENISLTLSIQDIRYSTGSTDISNLSTSLEPSLQEGTRILTVDGITLTSRNLALKFNSIPLSNVGIPTPSASTVTSRPHSPTSSDSSIDEETNFTMSQSLAMLPPKAISPSSSVSSSMYESAISTASSNLPVQYETINNGTSAHIASSDDTPGLEDTMLSISSQPLVLRINMPSSSTPVPESDPFISSLDALPLLEDQLDINLSIGIIACIIKPWQIMGLTRLIHKILLREDNTNVAPTNKPSLKRSMPPISAHTDIRAFVILLVPQSSKADTFETAAINDFFSHPLIPPRLLSGYIRIYLDTLSSSLSPSQREFYKEPSELESNTVTFSPQKEFCVGDISVFLFSNDNGDQASSLVAFPLLIMDPHLPLQYSISQPHPQHSTPRSLPTFDVVDWTREGSRNFGTRLSHWRCQLPKSNKTTTSHFALRIVSAAVNDGSPQNVPAGNNSDLQVSPFHIRLDLEYMLRPTSPLVFFEDLLLPEMSISDTASVSSSTTVDRYVSDSLSRKNISKKNATIDEKSEKSRLNIKLNFIRLSIRCPPPTHLKNRSGTLVLDFHDTSLFLNAKAPTRTTRFAEHEYLSHELDIPQPNTLFEVVINRVVLACSLVGNATATSFMSIGPLMEDNPSRYTIAEEYTPVLQPRISVIKPNGGPSITVPALAVSVDIPSVCVNLTKPCLDALQYWADDVNQLLERISHNETETEHGDSRDPSIIGSRFLARSKTSNGSTPGSGEAAENVIKVSITETSITIMLPRTDGGDADIRPFNINISDLDILIELNKQQSILTLGIMNLVVDNTSIKGKIQKFFSLTAPHSLATSAKSIVKLRFMTATVPETGTKETRVKLTLHGFTYTFYPSIHWITDLAAFVKNPPGTFESVIPSDRTRISVKISNGSIRALAPSYPGAIVSHMQEFEFSTDVVGDSRDSSFHILATCLTLLATDDIQGQDMHTESNRSQQGVSSWTAAGYALLAEVPELDTTIVNQVSSNPLWKVLIDRVVLRLHLCADTLTAISAFSQDMAMLFNDPNKASKPPSKMPSVVDVGQSPSKESTLMASVEDLAFKKMPEIGPAPDMIFDDLPTNLDYLDESFGAAAGLRELVDEDLDQFGDDEIDIQTTTDDPYVISRIGGETIKVFDPEGLEATDDYYLSIPPEKIQEIASSNEAALSVRIMNGSLNLFLYDGYDWAKTRKTIEEEVKEMRKRLAKIRQLVANGQMQEPMIEDTSALLYNSVHIGLDQDEDALGEPTALIAAIDEALGEDLEIASQSSWQSLQTPSSNKSRIRSPRVHGKRLTRSRTPSIEFSLAGLYTEFDQYGIEDPLVSRTFVTVRDLEILDHIKTSTWKKFLTDLRSDSRGNVRETDSNMVRIELKGVRPVAGNSSEEVRLRAKILPLRLYVDQDAVDFLKKFFSFKDPNAIPPDTSSTSNEGETYIQLGEIFPVDLKLDYKPRRVDYRALKEGRTIELMNFFHFDGAEMTLRHITLAGVTGWPKFFEMLNDLWTPDVKATQLVEVISGVAPIRSVVNVGSGVADLILLPIAQYKKDGRIVRGVQKGATAFVKSTAIEAIKMGAKLATGTQVILEQAEGILGGQFDAPITAEPVQVSYGDETSFDDDDNESADLISKYAQQPSDLREGVQSAYKSLQRNLNSAAQTILAVPMEVYERSGNEGPVRSVIRAVPIAVLKPMIGASEAVSKTLLGLHNTLDPNVRHDNEAKYKLR